MKKFKKKKNIFGFYLLGSMLVSLFAGDLFISPEKSWAQEGNSEPDLQKEQQFYEIYTQYNQNPTPEEQWGAAVAKQPQIYSVQSGDTLWNISRTLFNDPFFWPKIWSINAAQILNPHQIEVGQSIQFIPGTVDNPPSVGIAENPPPPAPANQNLAGLESAVGAGATSNAATDPAAMTAATSGTPSGDAAVATGGETAGAGGVVEAPKPKPIVPLESLIPPPRRFSKILRNLPNSLPSYTYSVLPGQKDLVLQIQNRNYPTTVKYLEYFLNEGSLEGAGRVVEADGDYGSASLDHNVVVSLKSPPGEQKIFTVVHDNEELELTSHQGSSEHLSVVQVQGEVEVLGRVNGESEMYRARVRKILWPITVKSKLIAGGMVKYNYQKSEINSNVKGKVVAGQNGPGRSMMGVDEIIYLNVGSEAGLQEGQSVMLYRNENLRRSEDTPRTRIKENLAPLAVAKVLRTTSSFATAVVISSREGVWVGDFLGQRTAE